MDIEMKAVWPSTGRCIWARALAKRELRTGSCGSTRTVRPISRRCREGSDSRGGGADRPLACACRKGRGGRPLDSQHPVL